MLQFSGQLPSSRAIAIVSAGSHHHLPPTSPFSPPWISALPIFSFTFSFSLTHLTAKLKSLVLEELFSGDFKYILVVPTFSLGRCIHGSSRISFPQQWAIAFVVIVDSLTDEEKNVSSYPAAAAGKASVSELYTMTVHNCMGPSPKEAFPGIFKGIISFRVNRELGARHSVTGLNHTVPCGDLHLICSWLCALPALLCCPWLASWLHLLEHSGERKHRDWVKWSHRRLNHPFLMMRGISGKVTCTCNCSCPGDGKDTM